MYTWLTVDMVCDHLRNLSKRKKQQGSEVLVEANSPPSASASLSDSPPMRSPMIRDSGYKGIARMANEIAECTPSPGDFSAPDHNLRILSGAVDDPQQAQQGRMCTTTTPSSITLGRPKGSTQQHSRDLKQRIRLATTDSAKQFSAALEGRRHGSTTCQRKHRHESSRLPMGTLQGIIAAAKAKKIFRRVFSSRKRRFAVGTNEAILTQSLNRELLLHSPTLSPTSLPSSSSLPR